jgi:hypothetical protein
MTTRANVSEPLDIPRGRWSRIGRAIGGSLILSAIAASVISAVAGVGVTYVCTTVLGNYGLAVFVAAPLGLGFLAAVIYGYPARRSAGQCVAVATLGAAFLPAGAMLVMGREGATCVAMACLLWLPLAVAGGVLGWAVQNRWRRPEPRAFPVILKAAAALALIPMTFGFERAVAPPDPPVRVVETRTEVNAPPAVVWQFIVSQPTMPPPTEWVFRTGIAYPLGTRIVGVGVGASRYCDLSTGPMRERVTVWKPNQRLAFDVLETPPTMREWSFYDGVRPRHLDGYFTVLRGEFELDALPNRRTRLVGRSWYRTRITPEVYWGAWCDYIVHRVHHRVFDHVARLSEAAAINASSTP